MQKIKKLNDLGLQEIKEELTKCCSSVHWVNEMINNKPYNTIEELFEMAEKIWYSLEERDWREAFFYHPEIGEINSSKKNFIATKNLSQKEQSGINNAPIEILTELAKYNEEYKKKFGYIFIICATGKSPDEMLSTIKKRINNTPDAEIKIAMEEQNKITKLRLEKLI